METLSTRESAGPVPTGCCPPFDPASWDHREVVWHDRPFVRAHVHSVLHVPIDMGRQIVRQKKLIDAVGAAPAQGLMLCDDSSRWGTELYIDVTRPVPGAEMATLSGRFLTKVYDGPYRDAPKWMADMTNYVESQGRKLLKLYLAYTTCPKCAKSYGHNYVVAFAEVDTPRA